ncbi:MULTISPECIES: hypothetical protein [Micromonospora]|uniref:Uncharacterized protein n=1 Tax=Micromonospora yangpuensis TaxID=683228 RepID=A0A1C6VI37_9ACTN|nr:hypothetical protein [Micromonospora yangpuensis]SCL65877.1 hypothetical protein GA0070617_5891 [Micromonospora yangpuensis]
MFFAALTAAAVSCVGLPAGRVVLRGFTAMRGEATSTAAAEAYLRAVFESGEGTEISRCLCGEDHDARFREARELRRQIEPYASFGVDVDATNWRRIGTEGTVAATVNLRFTQIDPGTGNVTFTEGTPTQWRFHTREEQGLTGGWKVCRIEAPPLCGTYLRC